MQRHAGQRRHYRAFGCRGCREASRCDIDTTDILYQNKRYEQINKNLHMDASKHHQTHMIIQTLTTPLMGAPILDGAASAVTTDLRFYRPYWARTTG
eukprot:6178262-Pleurochrysis_carterae.AAC.6